MSLFNLTSPFTERQLVTEYRRLVKIYHPDISKETDAEEKFKQLTTEFERLKDETDKIGVRDTTNYGDQRRGNWENYQGQKFYEFLNGYGFHYVELSEPALKGGRLYLMTEIGEISIDLEPGSMSYVKTLPRGLGKIHIVVKLEIE